MKDVMKYKDYIGSVHFDNEALLFYGKIEFVRALITYEATDAKGLRKAFEEAVDDYLTYCQEQQQAPELPFKGSLNVRLGPELHRQLALEAARHHMSLNKFITDTLAQAIQLH